MICRKHPEQYPGVPCAKCIAEAWSDYIVDEPKEAEVSRRQSPKRLCLKRSEISSLVSTEGDDMESYPFFEYYVDPPKK